MKVHIEPNNHSMIIQTKEEKIWAFTLFSGKRKWSKMGNSHQHQQNQQLQKNWKNNNNNINNTCESLY